MPPPALPSPPAHALPTAWMESALSFLFPPICQICSSHRAGPVEGYVCTDCWQRPGGVRFIRPPFCSRCGLPFDGEITVDFACANCSGLELQFSSARSAVVASAVVLDVVHRYKYSRALWFEPFLADLLLRTAVPVLRGAGWDCIIPVPLHPAKQRQREFNQAERLARRLGNALGIPVRTDCLRRNRPTETQTHLSRKLRAENVHGAFSPVPGATLHGQRVVIIDDILTTGATTSACARVARRLGASDVCVWTVARGL